MQCGCSRPYAVAGFTPPATAPSLFPALSLSTALGPAPSGEMADSPVALQGAPTSAPPAAPASAPQPAFSAATSCWKFLAIGLSACAVVHGRC